MKLPRGWRVEPFPLLGLSVPRDLTTTWEHLNSSSDLLGRPRAALWDGCIILMLPSSLLILLPRLFIDEPSDSRWMVYFSVFLLCCLIFFAIEVLQGWSEPYDILKPPIEELFPIEPLSWLPLKILSPAVLSVLAQEEPNMLCLGPRAEANTWVDPLPLFPSFLLKTNRGLMSILGFIGICILGRVYWVVLTGSQDILFPIWGCSLLKSNSHFLATSLFRWFRSFCMAASNELRSFENWISLLPGFILLVFYSKGRSWFD